MSIECKVCNQVFETKVEFYKHLRHTHIGKEVENYEDYYRKYAYSGSLEKLGRCVVCGKVVPFINIFRGYRVHCCHECSQKDPEVRKKKKDSTLKTLQEKYGVINPSQIPGHSEKSKKTKTKRYGSVNNIAKQKQTCLERYGTDNVGKVQEVIEKRNKTNLEKYGTTFPANNSSILQKIKERNFEKYGVEWAQQRPEIKAKSVQTSRERYGGVLMESPIIREKIKQTCLEKYGVENNLQLQENIQKRQEKCKLLYGTNTPFENWEMREKAQLAMEQKYGTRYVMQVPEFFEKQKKHSKGSYRLRRYTFKSTGKTLSYLSNMEKTFLEDCDKLGLDIDRGDQVKYTFNNGEHIFNVDFRINFLDGTKQLVEIKGTNAFYFKALKSGLQETKNSAATEYSKSMEYKPYLYLLNYKEGDIQKWILN